MWKHLVSVALIADMTATGEVRRSASFTAGLLHDLGRLVLAHSHPGQYAEVIALIAAGVEATVAEERVFSTDHVKVGIEVARSWNLPEDIAETIGDHHYGAVGALSWVVWNSRRVSWSLGIGDGVDKPEGITLDPASEDAEIVTALGGPEKLNQTVAWYTGAMTGVVLA
jgi:putative nucleotidyltransferase with HDIG domain